jgi:hypothetical protein
MPEARNVDLQGKRKRARKGRLVGLGCRKCQDRQTGGSVGFRQSWLDLRIDAGSMPSSVDALADDQMV